MKTRLIDLLHQKLSQHLTEIEEYFTDDRVMTLVIRDLEDDENTVITSNDKDLEGIIRVLTTHYTTKKDEIDAWEKRQE